jgi:signal transduction histidine kinase
VLEVDLPETVAALGDEERVLQIGRILIENALVHTPAGTVVRLSASGDGRRPSLAVTDDGPGIPPEAQAHVFDRFYRLEGALASGSGLGLAIGRELAELMGGRLELESTSERTSFALVLPVETSERVREPSLV